jgi:hypothetical protein
MDGITKNEYNLIANLLTDRANICTRNETVCRELYESFTADYWRLEHNQASNLALRFREAGK